MSTKFTGYSRFNRDTRVIRRLIILPYSLKNITRYLCIARILKSSVIDINGDIVWYDIEFVM